MASPSHNPETILRDFLMSMTEHLDGNTKTEQTKKINLLWKNFARNNYEHPESLCELAQRLLCMACIPDAQKKYQLFLKNIKQIRPNYSNNRPTIKEFVIRNSNHSARLEIQQIHKITNIISQNSEIKSRTVHEMTQTVRHIDKELKVIRAENEYLQNKREQALNERLEANDKENEQIERDLSDLVCIMNSDNVGEIPKL